MTRHAAGLVLLSLALATSSARAEETLHQQIDKLIDAKAGGKLASPAASDAEFVRRVYLDFAGRIPTASEARSFLDDKSADKRAKLIDKLLAAPEYSRRMADLFHVVLMERLGDHADWTAYLRESFEKNKPWDQMVREMLAASRGGPKGAAFFLSKRLENYGQNPVDYPALTRDVGRLLLGKDFQCAQCHDHLFIEDYKQGDFQGLFAFVQNVSLAQGATPAVAEKPTTKKIAFMSVFEKIEKQTGPRLPGLKEVPLPSLKPGEEFSKPPDRKTNFPGELKFSTLAALSERLPTPDNPAFNRNIANRLWFLTMGRGLVHPLDLDHSGNPPSHPELLDLLAKEMVAHKYDLKWMFREMALTRTYQRSSVLPKGQTKAAPALFLSALERRLSTEQLLMSMLEATGEKERVAAAKGTAGFDAVKAKFVKAFANPPREPEESIDPSLKATLFVLNDQTVQDWLTPREGNLIDRLSKLADDKVAEELYLSVLTRLPTAEEAAEVKEYLTRNATRKPVALSHLAWALLASMEFNVNH